MTAPWLRFVKPAPKDAEEMERLVVDVEALTQAVGEFPEDPSEWPKRAKRTQARAKRFQAAVKALNALLPYDVGGQMAHDVQVMAATFGRQAARLEDNVDLLSTMTPAPSMGRPKDMGKTGCLMLCHNFFVEHGKERSLRTWARFSKLIWEQAHPGADEVDHKAWELKIRSLDEEWAARGEEMST